MYHSCAGWRQIAVEQGRSDDYSLAAAATAVSVPTYEMLPCIWLSIITSLAPFCINFIVTIYIEQYKCIVDCSIKT